MSIRNLYETRARAGLIDHDPAQLAAVVRLDALRDEIDGYTPASKSSALGWLFGARRGDAGAPRGLYLWGGVGRGKSMLMDMFFDAAAVSKKRRVHFHAFMTEIHAAIYAHRQAVKRGTAKGDDPIEPVADAVARASALLCFDEFSVTDIADAMILGRLFKGLFDRGVVVVATSNVEPGDLYRDGLNRALVLPSIDLLRRHMDVLHLDSAVDHRMEKLAGQPTFHVPADAAAAAALTATFRALSGHERGRPETLKVLGRTVPVPEARGSVARFGFADLCARPLGAADYLAIAGAYRGVIVDDIPVLTAAQRNEAKRFIILIDTLYEARTKFFASAAAAPAELFAATEGHEAFEFQRTVSRLNEMGSAEYMALPRGREGIDTRAVVET